MFSFIDKHSGICAEARALLLNYLDMLEEYDRMHLMCIAALRIEDREAVAGYRRVLQERELALQNARDRLQAHMAAHGCSSASDLDF